MLNSGFVRAAGKLTSILPHRLVTVPIRGTDLKMRVWLDSELGQARVHEQSLVNKFENWLTPGDVFLDIGSNIGLYSLIAANHGLSTHAVDPTPEVVERVRDNAELNGLAHCVTAYQYAIWKENGTVSFSVKETSQTNSVVEDNDAVDKINVPAITLTDFCAEMDIAPDLVKIDVEHAGHGVIDGGMELLTDTRPALFLEVHDKTEETAFREVIETLDYECEVVANRRWFATPS